MKNSATIPSLETANAVGYDIASEEETVVPPKGKTIVKTGISIAVPDGWYGKIAPRSGLAAKKFIDVGAGVIDAEYRLEIGVVLFNDSDHDFQVRQVDRIVQLIMGKLILLLLMKQQIYRLLYAARNDLAARAWIEIKIKCNILVKTPEVFQFYSE